MKKTIIGILTVVIISFIFGCAKPLAKNFYVLNYTPDKLEDRKSDEPYRQTIRLRPFSIEKAYAKTNIVYRENPYQLDYYPDHLWAVRPVDMITDLVFSHLEDIRLVETLVRRLDEKGTPDYELSGTILAIEEYDSGDTWYAHLKISVVLTDFRTKNAVYSRIFDQTRKVEVHTPIVVVQTLSEIMDYMASLLMADLDNFLYEAAIAEKNDNNEIIEIGEVSQ